MFKSKIALGINQELIKPIFDSSVSEEFILTVNFVDFFGSDKFRSIELKL